LHRSKHLGWGPDTHLYCTAAEFTAAFPARLQSAPRVLKRNRGNGGLGVEKVEPVPEPAGEASLVRVLEGAAAAFPKNCRWRSS